MTREGKIIEQLRKGGYGVDVAHRRPIHFVEAGHRGRLAHHYTRQDLERFRGSAVNIRYWFAQTGGSTTVAIHELDEHGEPIGPRWEGSAVCSEEDQFAYREGLRIALERALAEMKRPAPEPLMFGKGDLSLTIEFPRAQCSVPAARKVPASVPVSA